MPWWRNKNLQLRDIDLDGGKIRIVREIAKNRTGRQPRLMVLADWGMRQLLLRAQALGATEPQHYLLPLSLTRSRSADKNQKFDVNRPMTGWVKSWRKLTQKCNMDGFRFHDLRHTFRTLGAEAGVPLEVMMARSEEHTSELQSQSNLVCRLLLEKKKSDVASRVIDVSLKQDAVPRSLVKLNIKFACQQSLESSPIKTRRTAQERDSRGIDDELVG